MMSFPHTQPDLSDDEHSQSYEQVWDYRSNQTKPAEKNKDNHGKENESICQIQKRTPSLESGYSSGKSDALSKSSLKSTRSESVQEEERIQPTNTHPYLTVPVTRDGGYYILSPIDVSLAVPFRANPCLDGETILKIKQSSENAETVFRPNKYNLELLSNIYEFQPHGLKFHENITVKLPLMNVPSESRKVRLLYCNNIDEPNPEWLILPDEHDNAGLLNKFSWCIIQKYCYISLNHFCYIAVGATGDDTSEDGKQESSEVGPNVADGNGDSNLAAGNETLVQGSCNSNSAQAQSNSNSLVQEGDTARNKDSNSIQGGSDLMQAAAETLNSNPAMNNASVSSNTGLICRNTNSINHVHPTYVNHAYEYNEYDETSHIELTGVTSQPRSKALKSDQVYALLYVRPSWDGCMKLDLQVQLSYNKYDRNNTSTEELSNIDKKWDEPVDCKPIPPGETSLDIKLMIRSMSFRLESGGSLEQSLDLADSTDLPNCTFYLRECGIQTATGCHFNISMFKKVENGEDEIICFCFRRPKEQWLLGGFNFKLTEREMQRYKNLKEDVVNVYNHNSQQQSPSSPVVANIWNPTVINFNGPTTVRYENGTTMPAQCKCSGVGDCSSEHTPFIINTLSQDFCEVVHVYLKQKLQPLSKMEFHKILTKMQMYHNCNMNVEMFTSAMLMTKDIEQFKKLYTVLKEEHMIDIAEIMKHEIEKENIRTNMAAITQAMMTGELCGHLVTENIISFKHKEIIKSKNDDREKATYLLSDIILKIDRHKFGTFVKILNDNEHLHVSERFCIT